MWNEPTPKQLAKLPKLHETGNTPTEEIIIYLHFFIGGSDWDVSEFDGKDRFFGYVVLNNDYQNAEWGYFSLSELKLISVNGIEIDNDLHWEPCEAGKVENIMRK